MSDATADRLVRPGWIHLATGLLLVLLLVAITVRIAVPPRPESRLATWTFDPIAPPVATRRVPLRAGAPVMIRVSTGSDSIRRVDVFLEGAGVGPPPPLRVRLRDDDSGTLLASTTIPPDRIVTHGIVIAQFNEHDSAQTTRIEIEPLPAALPSQRLRLDGYTVAFPGLRVLPHSVPTGVGAVSVRAYGSVTSASQRLSFMYEHALARWSDGNRIVVPFALLIMLLTSTAVVGALVANVLAAASRRQAVVSTAIVLACLAPFVVELIRYR